MMNAVMSLVAASVVSISAGWTRLPDGNCEYIIQIEPEAIATLVEGTEISSQIPPEAREVRSYRIRVGRDTLPRESAPLTSKIGPPPAGTELDLGPTPDAPPNVPSPAPAAGAGYPPGVEPRHVGIHADGKKSADEAAHLAGYETDKAGEHTGGPGTDAPPAGGGGNDKEPTKALWAPLFGSLLALFASVGGNVFLGWTAVNMRGRYKALLAHQQVA